MTYLALLNFKIFVVASRPLPRDGAWRKTMEPQNLGNSPGYEQEVVERQRVAEERATQSP